MKILAVMADKFMRSMYVGMEAHRQNIWNA